MYKVLYFCLVILAYDVYAENHYIDDCLHPGEDPVLFYSQEISKEGAILRRQEETVRIPKEGFTPKIITCIQVINLISDEDGGYPKVFAGGVGDNYVTLYFESQMSKGYDFRAEVYHAHTTTAAY